MAYPANLDAFSTKVDGVDDILAAHMNAVQASIVAVQTELGLLPKGSAADLATRLGIALNADGTLKTAAIVPGALSITNGMLAADCVDSSKILNASITGADIAAATIAGANLQNSTIAQAQMANLSIGTAQVIDQAITAAKMANGTITTAQIASAGVFPDNLGLTIWNATGSTLTAGQLVYISGYNVANSLPQVTLAINNAGNAAAAYIVPASIVNGASGVVRRHWLSAANLNTGGSTVGNPVYSDTVAGGWTLVTPVAQTSRQQVVGRVVVVDATVGQIDFDLTAGTLSVIGRNDIQATAVGTAALSTIYTVLRVSIPMGTIGTAAGVYEGIQVIGQIGTLSAIHFVSSDSLIASDTNFITLAGVNKGSGAGSTALLTVVPTNTTKATGGQAVVGYTWNNLAGTSAVTAQNDVLSFTATVSGTLPNVLRNCYMVITLTLS